jgi:hypothetical protein
MYADKLAPLEKIEDYSTASRMRDKGDKLTGEKLASMDRADMVTAILRKAGAVSYLRLLRVLQDGCNMSK